MILISFISFFFTLVTTAFTSKELFRAKIPPDVAIGFSIILPFVIEYGSQHVVGLFPHLDLTKGT